jgi:hypothetical protein
LTCCNLNEQVPDYALIAEIMLFSEGFGDSLTLARKQVGVIAYFWLEMMVFIAQ